MHSLANHDPNRHPSPYADDLGLLCLRSALNDPALGPKVQRQAAALYGVLVAAAAALSDNVIPFGPRAGWGATAAATPLTATGARPLPRTLPKTPMR